MKTPSNPTSSTLAIAVLASAFLSACGPPTGPTAPMAPLSAAQPALAASAPQVPDASVPAADAVAIRPATAAKQQQPATRSNGVMTRAQESAAMPMAGQANDHSAPLPEARPASAR